MTSTTAATTHTTWVCQHRDLYSLKNTARERSRHLAEKDKKVKQVETIFHRTPTFMWYIWETVALCATHVLFCVQYFLQISRTGISVCHPLNWKWILINWPLIKNRIGLVTMAGHNAGGVPMLFYSTVDYGVWPTNATIYDDTTYDNTTYTYYDYTALFNDTKPTNSR